MAVTSGWVGGIWPALLQFQTTPLPGRHAIPAYLPNPMLVDAPTHSGSHELSYFNANCVAIALEVYVNRDLHILGI